jgi:acetyltransferase-like isoleucine patch superfamily enzyme
LVFIKVHRLSVGANSIISYGTQIKGPASFTCKDNAFLGIHCIFHCLEDVSLGFYSGLGPRCTVYTHGSFLPVTMRYPAKFAPVVIEDYVWIAMAVVIMPGAHIESNCIINPGVVINARVKSNSLIQQNPDLIMIQDLSRLQKISKKGAGYYHRKMITAFLESLSLTFLNEKDSTTFILPDQSRFISYPETNCIEYRVHPKKKILYDLGHFTVDQSRNSRHREFLSFIRLRFGVTLRTRYRSSSPDIPG